MHKLLLESKFASFMRTPGDGGSTHVENDPQIFTSIPSFIEAASYLSYLTSCFTGSDEEQLSRAVSFRELELVTISSGQSGGLSFDPCADSSTPQSDGASSSGSSHQYAAQCISSSSDQNGTSLFQSLITRVRKTVRGSADDIGWLERATDMPPVEDGTERFMELLGRIRKNEHKLPNSVVYLLVPGLFSNHGRMYFVNIKTVFSKMGLACHIAKIHSEASVEKNAREIKDYIEEIYWGAKKRVLLFGHSKGGVDSAAALSLYWSDLRDKVAGLVIAQSPYGGSPIASDILREGQLGDYVNLRKIMEFLICKILKGDLQALEDLTYERRRELLGRHPLPQELPILPAISPLAAGQPSKLPVVVPLAAALAACAQLLQVRYGEKSDGLVTRRDAEVPGSVVVRPERKLDHGWMVYSSLSDDDGEGDASQVCEALLTLLVEVAQRRRREISSKQE
ncbi:unnamed protein product [Spirodela intermedia]|uniref:Uncharacterized protein n=1 Tax=Spirodela intermedia TaxID=51605 RepID=A0A7I8JF78_SPIIN|nr:unnamed protein product [Spirodela intermedia]CAA6668797.1 unnamed protein product [Spirodela intermedia]